ncbi:hypothetical protein HMPREF9440_01827 [Sutterella parvirubra YIT 11816]|uniref:Uncharacterized protein n=1 Tax=Sutterella parvirubra YIT 11816 TaxID=762967 RepID=H3KGE7_9BURK|nr:hypothetical protein HMPREF9440_01827 [Sutterella parvirubra YIT 11816]
MDCCMVDPWNRYVFKEYQGVSVVSGGSRPSGRFRWTTAVENPAGFSPRP